MKLAEFNYDLPNELIAQHPLKKRDQARLLVLNRKTGSISHCLFHDIVRFFKKGDVLVLNNTRVFKARLRGKKATGGRVEILLIRETEKGIWDAMVSHAKRIQTGAKIFLGTNIYATVREKKDTGCLLTFNSPIPEVIRQFGIVPLPHYIKRETVESDEQDYQTVFAKNHGSIAAPTAGLHFTEKILQGITDKGIGIAEITLHIGPGTFKPIRSEQIENHIMDAEAYELSDTSLKCIKKAQNVVAVGTSVCRALETWVQTGAACGFASLFMYPGYKFKIIKSLVTNFHQPCSTPLLLVSAFAGKNEILKAYEEAVNKKYRFLSYGDAMLIL